MDTVIFASKGTKEREYLCRTNGNCEFAEFSDSVNRLLLMTNQKDKNCTMKHSLQFIAPVCLVSWVIAGVAVWLGMTSAAGAGYMIFGAAYMLTMQNNLQQVHEEILFFGI
jgi:hypothetical protein